MRFIVRCSAVLALAAALAACRSAAPGSRNSVVPPALPGGTAGLSEDDIHAARRLYIAKCAKCHEFYHPAGYSEGDWYLWMKKMSRKSKLDAEQEAVLSRYLGAFRLVERRPSASVATQKSP